MKRATEKYQVDLNMLNWYFRNIRGEKKKKRMIRRTTIHKNRLRSLLYSIGNSTPYSVIAYMGKECEKEWIYVYIFTVLYI